VTSVTDAMMSLTHAHSTQPDASVKVAGTPAAATHA
jgi:hypothetical protein